MAESEKDPVLEKDKDLGEVLDRVAAAVLVNDMDDDHEGDD